MAQSVKEWTVHATLRAGRKKHGFPFPSGKRISYRVRYADGSRYLGGWRFGRFDKRRCYIEFTTKPTRDCVFEIAVDDVAQNA